MSTKKNNQLGMTSGKASNILVKDLLWNFISNKNCYRCNKEMSREDFSIDHKTPWLDSDDPKKLFFDINNISFSHKTCNSRAGRKPIKYLDKKDALKVRRACSRRWKALNRIYNSTERRERYKRLGH